MAGQTVRRAITVPVEAPLRAAAAAARAGRGEGRVVEVSTYEARLYEIGLRAVEKCVSCAQGLPCDLHSADALGLAPAKASKAGAAPIDPERENLKLSDQWLEHWLKRYGTPAEQAAGRFDKCPLTARHFSAIAAARLLHGHARLRDAIDGVFASDFHTRRARPNLLKVMGDPAEFAAMLVGSAGSGGGSVQAGPDAWERK